MKVEITFPCNDPERVIAAIMPDNQFDQRERSKVKIKKGKGEVRVIIDAKDPVAARASANTYLKMLYLFEKVDKI